VSDVASSPPSLSVFFPAYNDGGTIASMVITAVQVCRRITDDFEVIVVNDGSQDYTAEVLSELQHIYPQLRVIHHQRNRGYGGALISGFTAATKDLVFYTDGDAQYDVRELPLLLERLGPDIDIVNGYKISRSDPWYRTVIGKLYHWIVKLAFGLRIRDVDCDYRLIRRGVLQAISLKSTTGTICVELVKKIQDAGFRFAEVPVHHYHRAYGKSQFFNLRRIFRTGVQLTQLWWELVGRRVLAREPLAQSQLAPEGDRFQDRHG
jgi:glycosyltransferase involved in cell wall biosynthesis